MRLNKDEKEALLELLDEITNRCPLDIERFLSDYYTRTLWGIFKKLRFEVKGY